MHVARWIIIPFLILAMVFTYSPLAREEVSQFWVQVRPGVIEFMDGLYAVIRNFVAGGDSQDGIEDNAPGVDYDLIITRSQSIQSNTNWFTVVTTSVVWFVAKGD
jgi:hypothetical protein